MCYENVFGYCEINKLGLSSSEQKIVKVYEASKYGVHSSHYTNNYTIEKHGFK